MGNSWFHLYSNDDSCQKLIDILKFEFYCQLYYIKTRFILLRGNLITSVTLEAHIFMKIFWWHISFFSKEKLKTFDWLYMCPVAKAADTTRVAVSP